jgi:nitrite reductase/ring-hydroxylating ferredoxin subunit
MVPHMSVILHGNTDFDQIVVKHPAGYEVILIKLGEVVHAYKNSCPHIGIGLDYGDGHCKHGDDQLICNMHGALFAADTGYCTDGPCSGDSLTRLSVTVDPKGRVLCASS